MIDKEKIRRTKEDIDDLLNQIQKADIQSSSKVEYYEKLAKLKYYLCMCCEKDEEEYSQRSMSMGAWRDDGRGGMGQDNSMRQMRGGNGRYMSGADAAYDSYAYGNGKDQIRQMMNEPGLSYEAKEYLRKAMETMR